MAFLDTVGKYEHLAFYSDSCLPVVRVVDRDRLFGGVEVGIDV